MNEYHALSYLSMHTIAYHIDHAVYSKAACTTGGQLWAEEANVQRCTPCASMQAGAAGNQDHSEELPEKVGQVALLSEALQHVRHHRAQSHASERLREVVVPYEFP